MMSSIVSVAEDGGGRRRSFLFRVARRVDSFVDADAMMWYPCCRHLDREGISQ